MAISLARIREIEEATRGQVQNPLWHEYRKNRLNASQFGRALMAYASLRDYRSTKQLDRIRQGMVNPGNFTNPAVEWGIKHEATALAEYENHTGNKVIGSGIWLFPEGDLAASPDGIVVDRNDPSKYLGLVEIKCPYKCARERIRSGADWGKLLRYVDNSNRLISTHAYYHQIQGQLCAASLEWCDFVVWCPTALLIQRINLDPIWRSRTLVSLHRIYQWDLLAQEDRLNRNLVWPPVGVEEVDLENLFSLSKDVRSVFVYCLAVHLGRWIYLMTHSTENWEASCQREYDKAKEKFCYLCFLRHFLYLWEVQHSSSAQSAVVAKIRNSTWSIPLVAKIRNSTWSIPLVAFDEAKTQLLSLRYSHTITHPACFCCKV